MMRSVGASADPRLLALREAATRLRRDLNAFRAPLADREIAERELTALDGLIAAGVPDEAALRHTLLLIAAAVGSVSALAPGVVRLRHAVELFGVPHPGLPATRRTPR
ncbi:DUF5955 family protein [Streptomyces hoynatensis]|uniref:Uncharacterized protein n=1 Tax=Streptomyces hoynatensis TaxID=1141874 RepID=A0A3A9YQP9_9ACTN|nr:DUF5955 family protein [Streptomyces hoynatensis]RKN38285.1 hypothetical protein D7294_24490 [Streptomyces hoynatensis]